MLLILRPAAPPFLLKIVISFVEWWSNWCINFGLSGTVVMQINSASTYNNLTKYKGDPSITILKVKEFSVLHHNIFFWTIHVIIFMFEH